MAWTSVSRSGETSPSSPSSSSPSCGFGVADERNLEAKNLESWPHFYLLLTARARKRSNPIWQSLTFVVVNDETRRTFPPRTPLSPSPGVVEVSFLVTWPWVEPALL